MSFRYIYTHIVRFKETDAAGVVYFANVLSFCHDAYEASLTAAGIHLNDFFKNPSVAVPIVEARVKFAQPLFCGDVLRIELRPTQVSAEMFLIDYQVWVESQPDSELIQRQGRPSAQASSRHVAIELNQRQRCPLPLELRGWLQQWQES